MWLAMLIAVRQVLGNCDPNHDAKLKLPLRAADDFLPD
jgi:hypothetical protein